MGLIAAFVLSFASPVAAAPADVPAGSSTGSPAGATPAATGAQGGGLVNKGVVNEDTSFGEDIAAGAIGTVAGWVGQGVTFGLNWVLVNVVNTQTVDVYQNCSAGEVGCWFQSQYDLMKTIGVAVMIPMALLALIQAVTKGSLLQVIKSIAIFLPIAFFGTAVAAQFVQLLVDITDDFSNLFIDSSSASLASAAENIGTYYQTAGESGALNGVLMIILALPMLVACLFVWLILLIRSASIYIATLFLPIAFATLIWPAASRQFRKLAQFLVAMILSKLVMVAGLSIAMASFAAIGTDGSMATVGLDGSAIDPAAATNDGGLFNAVTLNQIILFTAMLLVICFSPTVIMKFLDNFSFGEAAGSISNTLRRPSLVGPVLFLGRVPGMPKTAKAIWTANRKTIPDNKREAATTSPMAASLGAMGVAKKPQGGDYVHGYEIKEDDFGKNSSLDDKLRTRVMEMSHTNDANQIAVANLATTLAQDPDWRVTEINVNGAGALSDKFSSVTRVRTGPGNTEIKDVVMIGDLQSRGGKQFIKDDPTAIKRAAVHARKNGADSVTFVTANPNMSSSMTKHYQTLDHESKGRFNIVGPVPGREVLRDRLNSAAMNP